jgi:hypothetical protein
LTSKELKMQIFVMPAWMAGIRFERMAPENFHVNLGTSTPCWNDAMQFGNLLINNRP